MNRKRLQFGCTTCILALAMAVNSTCCLRQGEAQTNFEWNNTTNNNSYFDVASNWSPAGGPPATLDTADFFTAGTYQVWWDSITGTPTIHAIRMFEGNVTFLNVEPSIQRELIVNSNIAVLSNSTLDLHGMHLHSIGGAGLLGVLNLDGSSPTGARFSVDGSAGLLIQGSLNLTGGGILASTNSAVGRDLGSSGIATVSGPGSSWTNTQQLSMGYEGTGTLNINGGGQVTNTSGILGWQTSGVGNANVSGSGSSWTNSNVLSVGDFGSGTLAVMGGGNVSAQTGLMGSWAGSAGLINVGGAGSHLMTVGNLWVGGNGDAILWVNDAGLVTSAGGIVGGGASGSGTATVAGIGSQWINFGTLIVGNIDAATGTLIVSDGGLVSSSQGRIGSWADTHGTVQVDGPGSLWEVNGDLNVGELGIGQLEVADDGRVSVSGTTHIGLAAPQGFATLSGGRFEFGQIDAISFRRIDGTTGALAGTLPLNGYNSIESFPVFQNPAIDVRDVYVTNSGVLTGDGIVGSIENQATAEIRTLNGQWIRFSGPVNVNYGEINNFDGVVEFESGLTNQLDGLITGRGLFIADGGWFNSGVVAFAGGNADVLGDVDNLPGGMIVTSGLSSTVFYDDVIHNGAEIRTSAGSNTVFFGAISGAGNFTGTGPVFAEGDLRPGNSPAVVTFEGDLVVGTTATTEIELAGTNIGEFDQLDVAGDLSLSGTLNVVLLDGFTLAPGQKFLIASVDGTMLGQFTGYDEGAVIGNFGGTDLYITYVGGDGNDIVLFTQTPVLLGDVNLDGAVNLLDVDPFIDRLATGTYQAEADCDQNGVVNLLDVNPFIVILSGG